MKDKQSAFRENTENLLNDESFVSFLRAFSRLQPHLTIRELYGFLSHRVRWKESNDNYGLAELREPYLQLNPKIKPMAISGLGFILRKLPQVTTVDNFRQLSVQEISDVSEIGGMRLATLMLLQKIDSENS